MKTLSFKDIQFIIEALESLLKNYSDRIQQIEALENYEDEISDLSNDSLFLQELITDLQNQQTQELALLVPEFDLKKMPLQTLIKQGKNLSIEEKLILLESLTSSIREEYNLMRTWNITYLAIVHKVRSRGLLYAKLKQTKKAKIDRQQAAIIFYQQNIMAADEKVMQLLRELGRWQMIKTPVDLYRRGNATSPRMDHVRPNKDIAIYENNGQIWVKETLVDG